MTLTVHHLQRSQSERVVWLCEELGLDYELRLYQRAPVTAPPEYVKLHPLGAAPVITDGSGSRVVTLAESAAILEYLAQDPQYPEYLYWFHFANGSLHPGISRSMFLSMLQLGDDSPTQQFVAHKERLLWENVDERLKKSKYLAGDEITLADFMTVYSLSTGRVFLPRDLTEFTGITRYLKDVSQRPAYQTALKKAEPDFVPAVSGPSPPVFAALAGFSGASSSKDRAEECNT
ncbi:putative glutathione S-transferase [Paraphoma chrysanthemicola]|uniref:Glutathione S-transferase n=1 Tax=Paraphoma chrysanthemicola TaxID=798071 RepID=A0A8K0R3Q5_9PLEO|nr:putative glutathione S-transferase [Paraphoma chrysanthemicola]